MIHLLLVIIYLAFISMGLPDSLLGSAWPVMYQEFGTPVSYAGIISMIIAAGTIISSLQNSRLSVWLGTGKVTAASVTITAVALIGFSCSHSFASLCLWAVPYGLGAGCVDASLNNYIALHYASRHMNWLHCMWGIGASAGPYIMGYVLANGRGWSMGYRYIGIIQAVLSLILILSLPLWTKKNCNNDCAQDNMEDGCIALPLRQIIRIPGSKEIMVTFFCYCALEQTTGLWAGSYLVLDRGIPAQSAAGLAGLFFMGITAGRALSGFLSVRFNDRKMIRMGQVVAFIGIVLLFIPYNSITPLAGLVITGFGCAPVYPCIIHSTPCHFGACISQSMIGVQMAAAYMGTCFMPFLFGLAANHISASLFPFYLIIILLLMITMHETALKKCRRQDGVTNVSV